VIEVKGGDSGGESEADETPQEHMYSCDEEARRPPAESVRL